MSHSGDPSDPKSEHQDSGHGKGRQDDMAQVARVPTISSRNVSSRTYMILNWNILRINDNYSTVGDPTTGQFHTHITAMLSRHVQHLAVVQSPNKRNKTLIKKTRRVKTSQRLMKRWPCHTAGLSSSSWRSRGRHEGSHGPTRYQQNKTEE